jgi:hypothetical protein
VFRMGGLVLRLERSQKESRRDYTWWINTRDAVKRQGFGEKRMSKMFILVFACNIIIIIILDFVEIFILRLYKPLLTLLIFC